MINFYRIITIVLSVISIIAVLLTKAYIPSNLVLIPLIFLCLFLIFPSFSRYIFKNIGITVINFTMLIRYAISPLLMSLYGSNIHLGSSISMSIQSKAINLMLYEMIMIFITFAIFYKRFYSNKKNFKNIKSTSNLFGWIFVIITLLIVILIPNTVSNYSFIWSTKQLNNDVLTNISGFVTLVQLGQLVLTISILNVIYKLHSKKNNIFYLILSIIVILTSASFINGTSRFSIILPLVTGFFTIFILYKNYRKIIAFFSMILILVFIVMSTLLKHQTNISSHNVGFWKGLNTDLQVYFAGVANIGHAIETSYIYMPFNIKAILGDLSHSVMIINSYFSDYQSALVLFNNMFYKQLGFRDQILPLLGQGYLYFGWILAPLFSVIMILLTMFLDRLIYNSSSIFVLYIYTYLCLKWSLFFMSNATILISFFTNFVLILLIIAFLNEKILIRKDNK